MWNWHHSFDSVSDQQQEFFFSSLKALQLQGLQREGLQRGRKHHQFIIKLDAAFKSPKLPKLQNWSLYESQIREHGHCAVVTYLVRKRPLWVDQHWSLWGWRWNSGWLHRYGDDTPLTLPPSLAHSDQTPPPDDLESQCCLATQRSCGKHLKNVAYVNLHTLLLW